MKDQILKLAGVKSETAFYKKFPTEAAFMKVHGKAFKKAAMGASMVNRNLHQLTDFDNPPKAQKGINSPYDPSISGFGKKNPSLDTSAPRALGDLTGPTDFGMRNSTDTSKMFGNFQSGQAIGKGLDSGAGKIAGKGSGGDAGAYLQAGMDVVEGVSMIKGQNKAVKEAKQNSLLTGVQADAVSSQRQQPLKRYYTRPEDTIIQPEQLSPSYGVGTNILSAQDGAMVGGNPTEIQNTYAPNTLYNDLGYEPLNDSDQIKAFYHGGRIPMAQNGFSTAINQGGFGNAMNNQGGSEALGNISNMLINKGRGPSAGSKIGGGVGQAAGTYFGGPVGGAIGKFAGQALGSLVDQSGRNIEKYDDISNRNIAGMMGNYIPQQFSNVMEDGGWVSNDWQPQVIAKFGEYSMEDLLHPPADADMLRAGGHIRGGYTPPSERAMQTYAMGGELQVYRGEAEPISNNPYLPDGGETVMFRGPSHAKGGMPISYGQSPVEVEGGEPAVKLRDGGSGEDNMVVFGNLKINEDGANMLGNPKLKNQKFKNYVNDLSKIEAKQNKIINNSTDALDNLDVNNSFDKLKMSALQANLMGSNMKLKDIAGKKQDAANLQSAINDTSEEYGLIADDLAQGKIKQAKLGASISKAQGGKDTYKIKGVTPGTIDYNPLDDTDPLFNKENYETKWVPKVTEFIDSIKSDPEKAKEFISKIQNYGGQDFEDVRNALNKGSNTEEQLKIVAKLATDKKPGPYHSLINSIISNPKDKLMLPKPAATTPKADAEEEADVEPTKRSGIMDALNQVLPYLRPSDAENLDPRQLMGEIYALSNNQVEPVQAQTFQPQLQTPYDISLQDQLNEVTAQTRQAERLAINNPEALAAISGQANMAKSQILGEQMRMNQAQKAQVYGSNINTLNQAQLQNLQMYDTQQQRQEAAKSATKATTQEALSSVASKYAQNKLENKQLGVMENMYNYRFDKSGRAINMNPLAQFDYSGKNSPSQPTAPEGYEFDYTLKKKKSASTKETRNGSIVKAIKNL
jgi:hypothetical protein